MVTFDLESPYTKTISDGVLRLQEKGILTDLRVKWWNKMYGPPVPCVSQYDLTLVNKLSSMHLSLNVP